MTLPTPPKYVVLPEEVIEQAYAPDKPRRALLASFTRILSLAWEAKYERTPRMNEEELMDFLKLSRRQYYEQKADMELLGWLRSSHPVPGFVQFTFGRSIVERVPVASAENRTGGADSRTGDSSLIGGGESLINLKTDSIPPLKEKASAENRTWPSVVEILKHTDLLFDGSVVISKDLEDCIPQEALAWCAYAYYQFKQGRLVAPGGVVRNRLREGKHASEKMRSGWREILPEDFLDAIGLIERVPDSNLEEIERQSSNLIVIAEPVSAEIESAWETVLKVLQLEMLKAKFETWVRDSKVVRYHGNALSIGVRNAYARDWLDGQVRARVEDLLAGILGRSVSVAFVVREVES